LGRLHISSIDEVRSWSYRCRARKRRFWLLTGVCVALLGLGICCLRGAGNAGFARVRVCSLLLHRGMSSTNVARLLGDPTLTVCGKITCRDGSVKGACFWDYDRAKKPPYQEGLSINFVQRADGSMWVTNWGWREPKL